MSNPEAISLGLNHEVQVLLGHLRQQLPARPGIWLVGGAIRDLLEGRSPTDFDFALSAETTPLIKRWAAAHGGSWFWLDRGREQSRVIFGRSALQFDFSPLRAADIEADLGLRDYTLNAMALPFSDHVDLSLLLDPLGGRNDLARGILRACSAQSFADDPLRVLKGVRHHAQHGWQIESETARQMKAAAPLLQTVAGERIRSELGHILASERLCAALGFMAHSNLLEQLFPGLAIKDLTTQLAERLARLGRLGQDHFLATLLDEPIEAGLRRRELLLCGLLLQRVAPAAAVEHILQRLRFAVRSRSILTSLCGPRIDLSRFVVSATPRVAALKLERLGRNCVEQLLDALTREEAAPQEPAIGQAIRSYRQQLQRGRITDLLSGHEIIALTGLQAGQRVGQWQKKLKDAEIAGEISGKEGAVDWLRTQFYD